MANKKSVESTAAATAAAAAAAATAAATFAAAEVTRAIVGSDISYIKKDIAEIKEVLKNQELGQVSKEEFKIQQEMSKDHENRVRSIESNVLKWMGGLAVGNGVVSIIVVVFMKLIFH